MEKNKNINEEITNDNSPTLVYGRNTVLELLKSERLPEVIYIAKLQTDAPSGSLGKIIAQARDKKIKLVELPKEKLDEMAEGKNHQSVAALVSIVTYVSIKEIIENAKKSNKQPFIIIADQIEDTHNLGALIRTAEAVGADGFVIPRHGSAPINSTVYKTSAGAIAHLPIAKERNIVDTIKYLKSENIWVFGADMDGEVAYKTNLKGPIALVVGAEGKGIRPLVKENCDGIISLPMFGKMQSLNVSVAGGILMYEILRQRNIFEN